MSVDEVAPEAVLTGAGDPVRVDDSTQVLAAGAFESLVRTHQRQIYRILLLHLHDRDAAETLTQECFLRAYSKRHSFRSEAQVGTWLIRIALNLARDHGKSQRLAFWRRLGQVGGTRGVACPSVVPADPAASPERHLLAREHLRLVWAIVDRLPARQRTCFLLRYVEELTIRDIAAVLRIEPGTVKAHLARAVGTVRRHLQESTA